MKKHHLCLISAAVLTAGCTSYRHPEPVQAKDALRHAMTEQNNTYDYDRYYGKTVIDANGDNLFEKNKVDFNKKKDAAIEEICKHVSFIK